MRAKSDAPDGVPIRTESDEPSGEAVSLATAGGEGAGGGEAEGDFTVAIWSAGVRYF